MWPEDDRNLHEEGCNIMNWVLQRHCILKVDVERVRFVLFLKLQIIRGGNLQSSKVSKG